MRMPVATVLLTHEAAESSLPSTWTAQYMLVGWVLRSATFWLLHITPMRLPPKCTSADPSPSGSGSASAAGPTGSSNDGTQLVSDAAVWVTITFPLKTYVAQTFPVLSLSIVMLWI